MIAALERLKLAQNAPPLPEEMRAFAISAGRVQALFASHPPLDRRIAALKADSSRPHISQGDFRQGPGWG